MKRISHTSGCLLRLSSSKDETTKSADEREERLLGLHGTTMSMIAVCVVVARPVVWEICLQVSQ